MILEAHSPRQRGIFAFSPSSRFCEVTLTLIPSNELDKVGDNQKYPLRYVIYGRAGPGGGSLDV